MLPKFQYRLITHSKNGNNLSYGEKYEAKRIYDTKCSLFDDLCKYKANLNIHHS